MLTTFSTTVLACCLGIMLYSRLALLSFFLETLLANHINDKRHNLLIVPTIRHFNGVALPGQHSLVLKHLASNQSVHTLTHGAVNARRDRESHLCLRPAAKDRKLGQTHPCPKDRARCESEVAEKREVGQTGVCNG